MHALPFVISLATAALIAPALLRALRESGCTAVNYRGRPLPCPFGVLVLAAATLALVPLLLIQRLAHARVFEPRASLVALYALGVLALGLLDDAFGSRSRAPRGLRGHGAALLRGELSTGALKAGGALGLALLAAGGLERTNGRWLLAAAVLVLATNAFNLLDLRPGRSLKALVALAALVPVATASVRALWTLGLFLAPALVAGAYDLRERAMLGDTGANLMGALAGFFLVLEVSATGQLIALALLAALTLYGELRSITALVERIPLLRELDSWGRPS